MYMILNGPSIIVHLYRIKLCLFRMQQLQQVSPVTLQGLAPNHRSMHAFYINLTLYCENTICNHHLINE